MQVLEEGARTLIQIVNATWSKASRGGPLATRRNRVPLALPFDSSGFDESEPMWIEQQFWDEPDFAHPDRIQRLSKNSDFHLDGLVVRHLNAATTIMGSLRCGAPERHASVRYELKDEQWARLRWNGRMVDFDNGHWWYEMTTLNVARIRGTPAPDVFTSRVPTFNFQSLARLR